jgi:hypothetical protein
MLNAAGGGRPMKKITLATLSALVAVSIAVADDDIFFPSKNGTVATTANFNGKGKLEGYTRMAVKSVSGSGGNKTVAYTVQPFNHKMQPIKPGELEYAVTAVNGTIEYSMKPWAAISGGKDIEIAGTEMRMPSRLAPGDKLPDANVSMTLSMAVVGKVTADVAVTGRKCVAIETVTVPAGTFECWKVVGKSTTVANMLGKITMINNTTAWYARGVGLVKSLDRDEKGTLRSSSELKELAR